MHFKTFVAAGSTLAAMPKLPENHPEFSEISKAAQRIVPLDQARTEDRTMRRRHNSAFGWRTAAALLMLLTIQPASAMNQEGHDGDWMSTIPQAQALLAAIPDAKPLPSRRCPVTPDMVKANPYEQIPLPRHGCAMRKDLEAKDGNVLKFRILGQP